MSNAYCIKAGYEANLDPAAFDPGSLAQYWTPERITLSSQFQYDVYRIGARLVRRCGYDSVLDVGSGPPTKLPGLFPSKGLVVQLVDQPSVERHAEELLPAADFLAADLETIEADLGRRFDLILCADVLEHLLDPDPCLRFIRQHMKPHGRALLSTPERDILRGVHCTRCEKPEHVREWNRKEFRQYLESRSFRVDYQRVLPQGRTPFVTRFLGSLRARLGAPPHWWSCQLACCSLASHE